MAPRRRPANYNSGNASQCCVGPISLPLATQTYACRPVKGVRHSVHIDVAGSDSEPLQMPFPGYPPADQTFGRSDDQDPMVVFRLTELRRNLYDAAFRSHSGRWDLMPGSRPLDEMAQGSSRSRSLIYRQITIKANLRDPVLGCSDGNSRTPFDIGSF